MNQYDYLTVEHTHEVDSRKRFQLRRNWSDFLQSFNEERIGHAEESLKQMLDVESLRDKSFVDVGSGSGSFSLAARRYWRVRPFLRLRSPILRMHGRTITPLFSRE